MHLMTLFLSLFLLVLPALSSPLPFTKDSEDFDLSLSIFRRGRTGNFGLYATEKERRPYSLTGGGTISFGPGNTVQFGNGIQQGPPVPISGLKGGLSQSVPSIPATGGDPKPVRLTQSTGNLPKTPSISDARYEGKQQWTKTFEDYEKALASKTLPADQRLQIQQSMTNFLQKGDRVLKGRVRGIVTRISLKPEDVRSDFNAILEHLWILDGNDIKTLNGFNEEVEKALMGLGNAGCGFGCFSLPKIKLPW